MRKYVTGNQVREFSLPAVHQDGEYFTHDARSEPTISLVEIDQNKNIIYK